VKPSTKALMAKHGWRIDKAAHNYIYFSFYAPYVWVLTLFVDRVAPLLSKIKPLNPIVKMMVNRYHAKMLSGENVTKILELEEDVCAISDKNKGIVPFHYAYKILLQDPDFIAVMDCPCKKAVGVTDPELLNSCICVGRKTAQFWLDRCGEKYHARRISQREALDMVRSFRERGYITQAFFKVATGGSTGVICNCSVDSCSALRAHLTLRKWDDPAMRIAADSGYSVRHDESRCAQCGTCVKTCQFGGVETGNGKRTGYRRLYCLGCGLCVEHCPNNALELYRDPEKCVPLDMDIVRAEYLT
jgi:Pyruvate/2-oxoacid:ferredoxin oxidoreductase delta subunit